MTSPEAAMRYALEHKKEMEGKGTAVYNPKNLPTDSLPSIFCFVNGGGSRRKEERKKGNGYGKTI